MNHPPICGIDGAVMTCTHTGRRVLTHTEDGLEHQLWSADEFTCPACKAKVVALGLVPISEHWKPDFAAAKAQASRARGGMLLAYYGRPPASSAPPATPSLDAPPAEAQNPSGHGKEGTPPATGTA